MCFHCLIATCLLSLVDLETEISSKQKEGFKTGKNNRARFSKDG